MLVFPRPRRRIEYDPNPEPIRPVTPLPTTPVVEVAPPPLTTDDRRGRPRIVPGVPSEYRLPAERELMDRLESYEPRKRSRLRMIGLSALRGLAAGPGGAITGALFGAGTALLDPTAEDRVWQERQIAESQQRQGMIRAEQRGTLQDELLNAQVAETRAQAEARRNPRPRLVEQVLPDGTTVLTPEREGVITGRVRPATPRIAVEVPGVGPIEATPEAALGYYGQVGRREDEQAEAERIREQKFTAAQQEFDSLLLEEEVARQEKERAYAVLSAMRQSPATAKEDISQAEAAATTADRAYQSFAEKKRDALRRVRENQGGRTRTSLPIAPPPPPGVSEASIRAEARQRGANEEDAVKRAKGFGWIP